MDSPVHSSCPPEGSRREDANLALFLLSCDCNYSSCANASVRPRPLSPVLVDTGSTRQSTTDRSGGLFAAMSLGPAPGLYCDGFDDPRAVNKQQLCGDVVGRVISSMSMSLDGFISAPDDSREQPLGDGGERLHEWLFGGQTENDAEVLDELIRTTGAVVSGREDCGAARRNHSPAVSRGRASRRDPDPLGADPARRGHPVVRPSRHHAGRAGADQGDRVARGHTSSTPCREAGSRMTPREELEAIARDVIDANKYMALGTAD